MANLITVHDPFHIHKFLGSMALLHFLFRFSLFLTTGNAFPPSEPVWRPTVAIAAHGLLSWSSLLFQLPLQRNFTSPVIWPEFRLHSILFASRHVVCTLLTLHSAWPEHPLKLTVANAAVILGTIRAASEITERYGDREKRTTNAFPYPASVTIEQRDKIKESYAMAQFAATHVCILGDATITFFCLLAIQTAPLLMTLVRKGKIGTRTYHVVYAFTLWLGFVVAVARFALSDGAFFGFASLSSMVVRHARLKYRVNSYILWAGHVVLIRAVYPSVAPVLPIRYGFVWLVPSVFRQIRTYAPLLKF